MITITELAANKVKENIERRGKGLGIQIGVKTTGCSGLTYVLEYVDIPPITKDWITYEHYGLTIWVKGSNMIYVNGLQMDWIRRGLNEGFKFVNPNEKDRCGCGESFRV
jgi:iron-sulfur cluster assembly protein